MTSIPFLNIADTNCWIVYLMPFDASERTGYEKVNALQQACISRRIFGMGWTVDCFAYGTPMTAENASEYIRKYNHQAPDQDWTVSEAAVKDFKSIRRGDYVIMRLKNGHYYVGCVSSDGCFYMYKQGDPLYGMFSWGGSVDRWVEYENDGELPSEIVGRFSQCLHSTIQRIGTYRQRLLVIAMYEAGEGTEKIFNVPKLRIGRNNFVRSLNYMELEDLVALYIANKHADEGYKLLPSSCKISQQNYEFRFVSGGKKPITCQVKNQETPDIERYTEEKSYAFIYVFSGKWSEEDVRKLNEQYREYAYIYVISPTELFNALKENAIFSNTFYDFENEPVSADALNLSKFTLLSEGYPRKYNECIISENKDFVCFVRRDGLFYAAEFGALVLSRHILDDREYEIRCAENILADINVLNHKDMDPETES